ncbi:helix-turn-helix domain-containing protein, partial [Pediococcus acidilactici]
VVKLRPTFKVTEVFSMSLPYEQDAIMTKSLGQKIAAERKRSHLTQKQLAQDICSQPMISSIEKGAYIPNAFLLAKLCQRLNISLDNAVLSNYPQIDGFESFNKQIQSLCNQHAYHDLLKYLSSSPIISSLYKNTDFQIFYYYQGVAEYQAHLDAQSGLKVLQLADTYRATTAKQLTSLDILVLSGIAFLQVETNAVSAGMDTFKFLLTRIKERRFTKYDENINIFFYLYGLSLFRNSHYHQSLEIVSAGIDWTTANSSTYMLSDLFFLLSETYNILKHPTKAQDALQKSQLLEDIFKVKTFKSLK